ncbi:hypothetical protein AVEN_33904-1 [Araneus ventricosus]|uniref:Uncharacterized protein n=1 Tax=Araneus ventricosus TaxID=182803 RepID=A0A4Y2EH48_ARAVE|nr:hypothetical protein AVEN_33904-1 [Araneus ventricosus]
MDSPNLGGHLLHHPPPSITTIKAHGNGLWLARIIRPPTALISEATSEPHLPSKEDNRPRTAFLAVKGECLDRPGPPRCACVLRTTPSDDANYNKSVKAVSQRNAHVSTSRN